MTHPFSHRVVRGVAAISLLAGLTACGGGSTPAAPSTTSVTPPAPSNNWSAAGRISATGTSQTVGGATLTPGWSLAAVTADGQGNYQLGDVANPPSTPYPVSVSGNGMVTHDTWITWARGPRTGVNVNMIRNSAPFSMDFYRQFVRGTYDHTTADGAPF